MAVSALELRSHALTGLDTAVVALADPDGRTVTCRTQSGTVTATLAVPFAPEPGDTVVLAAANQGGYFVLGVVSSVRATGQTARASNGANAVVETDEDQREVLRVRDDQSRVLFEYRPESGRCTVLAPAGDLELRAAQGAIALTAATSVRVQAGTDVELEGQRARVKVQDATVHATTLSTTIERVRHTVGEIETRAVRLFERVQTAFREAEELAQTRAGQIRILARDTFHLRGRRAVIRAQEDIKLKGEKIHLA